MALSFLLTKYCNPQYSQLTHNMIELISQILRSRYESISTSRGMTVSRNYLIIL
jgi:hypothetical protein